MEMCVKRAKFKFSNHFKCQDGRCAAGAKKADGRDNERASAAYLRGGRTRSQASFSRCSSPRSTLTKKRSAFQTGISFSRNSNRG
jgi:hypothetical protein